MSSIKFISDFHSYCAAHSHVSFDLFDTLIRRRFLKVNEVHDTVSAYALSLIGQRHDNSPFDLTLLRYRTTDALKTFDGTGTQEPLIEDVWDRIIARRIPDDATRLAMVGKIVGFEIAIELANLALVEGALDLLRRLKADGKTLVAISDMYFDMPTMRTILDKLGILDQFDHVYVSAESRLTKQSGDLFRQVLSDLDLQPHEILHVGDNRHSDIKMATQSGISSVLVEQEHLLELERPAYGRRPRIEEDVADIVKVHLASLLFDAVDKRVEHLYFLARDGCAINEFMGLWDNALISKFLPSPPRSDMYMNRILSCWGGVDFAGDWLIQAIGLVFWLNHGEAGVEEMCGRLGVELVPPALGSDILRADRDTFRVAKVLVEAGLEERIKAAILDKQAQILRNLHDIGFFENGVVAFSDVGYSGTVLRDLNSLFVSKQGGAQALHPPTMHLHLIATNANYEKNRAKSYPFANFSPQVVLPGSQLTEELLASFSWLEYFFKHRTLKPILRFVERDGGLFPELRHDAPSADRIPTERVLDFAPARDEDIVLLWMAAVNFHGPLVEPLVERFTDPDAQTISQMEDEIFEQHSVLGAKRSIILRIPGGRVEAIALAAREGDFWIPGSIAASRATPDAAMAPVPEQGRGRSRLSSQGARILRRLRRRRTIADVPGLDTARDFDAQFYRDFYPDVRHFRNDQELWQHYFLHGRGEKRFGTYQAFILQLTTECGPLPVDFDPVSYLAFNADIAVLMDTPERALDHYMRMGRSEGRVYRQERDDLAHDFDVLLAEGKIVLSKEEIGRRAKGASVLAVLLQRYGLRQGPWIDKLNVAEFRALNSAWAGDARNKAQCIVALLEKGLPELPALSLTSAFDADFYRTQVVGATELSAQDLYLHYLSEGALRGLSPSEAAALERLWGFSVFPEEFDWEGFAVHTGLSADPAKRVQVLRRFIETPGIERIRFVSASQGAHLLAFIATRASQLQGRTDEVKALFEAGLKLGGEPGAFHHQLGDLAMHQDRPGEALVHFRKALQSASPDRWSYLHAAQLLVEQGDYASALAILSDGEEQWQQRAPWRRIRDAALQLWSEAILRDVHAGALAPADKLYHEIAAALPSPLVLTSADKRTLLLTSHALPDGVWDRTRAGTTICDLSAIERGEYLTLLLAHEEVVLHDVPFTAAILNAIALARSLGRRTIAWVGQLVDWEGRSLAHRAWDAAGGDISPLQSDNFMASMLPARYCDQAITTLAGCMPLLEEIVPGDVMLARVDMAESGLKSHTGWRYVLAVPISDVPSTDVQSLVKALRAAADADPQLHFLVDRRLSETGELRDIAGRWDRLDENITLPTLSATIGICDAVVQVVRSPTLDYAAWAEAHAQGIPVVVVSGTAHVRKDEAGLTGVWPDLLEQVAISDTDAFAAWIVKAAGAPRNVVAARNRSRTPDCILNEAAPAVPVHRRRRILFANIFFAPQTIGGATRVLKDNIDYCLDHYADDFELAVFCADEQNERNGEWRLDVYRGIPVFRVSTPQEINMDWRAANEMVARRFAQILRTHTPDLVHIHCLQRLGVIVAETCKEFGIPYVVTLHDAWWLSDYPFLTDKNGRPVSVGSDFRVQKRLAGVAAETSLLRARRLREALTGAHERLAVSESFARIYRDCGIECQVIENGSSRIKPAARQVASDGRVHLCHVGGLEHHKGAYLIEAALRRYPYKNLHFTVVDLARGPGQETQTVWGTTPVTITGKMSTQEIAQFYARMNVLIAPSTWPESYGLVTREALAHGLWVIASDQGATADPVHAGENGFVVSVEGGQELALALEAIDAAPATYRSPPLASPTLRMVDEQSAELVRFYQTLLLSESRA